MTLVTRPTRVTIERHRLFFSCMGSRAVSARTDAGRVGAALVGVALPAIASLSFAAPTAVAQSGADLAPCIPDGTVNAITHANGNTYIGGQFDAVGQRSGSGVPLAGVGAQGGGGPSLCQAGADPETGGSAPTSGEPLHPFPEVSGGEVHAAIADGQGGWYIGGTFTSVDGQPRDRLAHIGPGGTVDDGVGDPTVSDGGNGIECDKTRNCEVNALALDPIQGVLYVGGSFDGLGSGGNVVAPSSNLAAIDPGTGAAIDGSQSSTNWTPSSPNGPVNALEAMPVTIDVSTDGGTTVTPSKMSILVLGGSFSTLGAGGSGGAAADELGAVWGVGATQSCFPAPCDAVQIGGAPVQTAAGSTPSGAWNPAANTFTVDGTSQVSAVAIGKPLEDDGTSGGTPKPCGSYDPTTQTVSESGICTEYIPVYAGGIPHSGAPLQAFQLQIVTRMRPPYSFSNPTLLPGIAGSTGSQYTNWNVAATSPAIGADADGSEYVSAIALSPQPDLAPQTSSPSQPTVYLGGDFTYRASPGTGWSNLAAVQGIGDPSSSSGTSATPYQGWTPNESFGGFNGPVNALAVATPGASDTTTPDTVYAGGAFTHGCGTGSTVLCDYAAAFSGITNGDRGSPATGSDAANPMDSWKPSLEGGAVDALALDPSAQSVFAGGAFESTGAVARDNLAAFDGSGNLLSWDPGASISSPSAACMGGASAAQVDALTAAGSTIYAGGSFDTAGGSAQCNLAALDASTGAPPGGFVAPNPDNAVLALSSTGNAIYAGGEFTQIGGQSRTALAKLDPATGAVDPTWNPGPTPTGDGSRPASVDAIAAGCSRIYVGGDFATVAGQPRNDLAALDATTGAASAWNPDAGSYVYAIQPVGTLVYVAGNFPEVGSGGGPYVAALDSSTGKASPNFYAGARYTVPALAVAGSTVYLGQTFGGPGGTGGVQNLIAVGGDPSSANWGHPIDGDIDPNTGVSSDAPFDPYTTAYPDPDGNGDSDTPAPGGDVLALSAYGQTLYVGGDFTSLGTRPQEGFAAIPLSADAGTASATCVTPKPAVQISGSGAFGSQVIHTTSAPHAFTITNSGTANLVIPAAAVALVGTDSGQYLESSDGCSAQTLAPGGSCTVQVSFTPGAVGPHNDASVQVTDNAPDSPQTVALSGSGTAPAPRARRLVLALTNLRQSHRRWRDNQARAVPHTERPVPHAKRRRAAGSKIPVGTTFSFVLSERARVTFVFTQRLGGRVRGHQCVPPTRRNRSKRRCTRTVTAGTMTLSAHATRNKVRFKGRLSRTRRLKPGAYTVYVFATDSSGQRSATHRLAFTIVP